MPVEVNKDILQKSINVALDHPVRKDTKQLSKEVYYMINDHIEFMKSYKLQDRYRFQGLYISIENKAGSERHWYDPMKDEHGTTKMKYDYGYIRLTEGADGEHVDCYIGPDKEAGRVYVIHQNNPTNGKYDEDKVMLGFNSADEARQAYMDHYDDPKFFGSIEEYNFLTFADKVMRKKGKVTGKSLVLTKSKYISKKMVNGKWVYKYPEDKKPVQKKEIKKYWHDWTDTERMNFVIGLLKEEAKDDPMEEIFLEHNIKKLERKGGIPVDAPISSKDYSHKVMTKIIEKFKPEESREDVIARFLKETKGMDLGSKEFQKKYGELPMDYHQEALNKRKLKKSIQQNEPINIDRLNKSRRMPIGTISKGRKKVAEGKWVPVKKEKVKKDDEYKTPSYKLITLDNFVTVRDEKTPKEFEAFVTKYTPEEYKKKGTKTFLSASGKSGFAITEAGDLVSVFSEEGAHEGSAIMKTAIKNGAKTLDCFGDVLPKIYSRFGFEVVETIAWDDQYAPDNWNYEKHGRPNVNFMKLNPEKVMKSIQNNNKAFNKLSLKYAKHLFGNMVDEIIHGEQLKKSAMSEIDYAIKEMDLRKAVKIKKHYTSEDVKNMNLRWVTIRGNHVLIRGMADGSYIVVGGAGGKLNHMKIDRLLSKEEYSKRREEKKKARLTELTKEEIHEQAEKRKVEVKQKKVAKTAYETKVKDILGITAESIKASISEDEMDAIYTEAKKKVAKKKAKDKKEEIMNMEAEAEKLIKQKTEQQIKKAEKEALNVLANEFFGEDESVIDKAALRDKIDVNVAMDILKARKEFKKEVKEIVKPERYKQRLSFTDKYAQSSEFTEEDILKDVKKHIETQQNMQLYDILDRQSESIQKHINVGSAEALNGIVSDIYAGGAALSNETINALGMEACTQLIANQLYADGKAEEAKNALIKYAQETNSKTVKHVLTEIEKRFHNVDVIKSLAGKEDDPEAILSVASANGYSLRQLTRGQQILGTAVGSLRSSAHLIDALEEGEQDKVFIDMGTDLARARKQAKKAGLRRGEYKIKSKLGGEKGFVMEIPKETTSKFFERNKQLMNEETKIDKIKSLKENTGYVPEGMKEGVKLADKQEAALRFFNEKDKVLLDFQAGLGKTAIGYAAIAEAMKNKGAKKVLFVTPAKLRTQTSEEGKKFLSEELASQIKNTEKMSVKKRRELYQQDGIHFIGHDLLRIDAEELKNAGYDMVIVDEIHEMTNQRDVGQTGKNDSARYRGMMGLADVPLKIGMSGTNIKSSKKELYKKINFIEPEHTLGTMKEFEDRYKGLNQGTNAFQDSANDAFRKELADYTYTQKMELEVQNNQEEIRMPMTPSQKKAYKQSEQLYMKEKHSENPHVRKAAAAKRDSRNYDIVHDGMGSFENSKIDSIIDRMENVHSGEKAVIHCYRKNAIKTAVKKLEDKYGKGIVGVIDGDSSKAHVSEMKKTYNDPSSNMRFLIGTKSVEAGLNLQYGGRVTFHLDVPMDEASKQQREARQYRRGQNADCHSYLLVTETPFDINKVDQMEKKGREMKILGNPKSVESKDESGFLSILNQVEERELVANGKS